MYNLPRSFPANHLCQIEFVSYFSILSFSSLMLSFSFSILSFSSLMFRPRTSIRFHKPPTESCFFMSLRAFKRKALGLGRNVHTKKHHATPHATASFTTSEYSRTSSMHLKEDVQQRPEAHTHVCHRFVRRKKNRKNTKQPTAHVKTCWHNDKTQCQHTTSHTTQRQHTLSRKLKK